MACREFGAGTRAFRRAMNEWRAALRSDFKYKNGGNHNGTSDTRSSKSSAAALRVAARPPHARGPRMVRAGLLRDNHGGALQKVSPRLGGKRQLPHGGQLLGHVRGHGEPRTD